MTATAPPPVEVRRLGQVCWRCGSTARPDKIDRLSCPTCRVTLVHCDLTGEWVSTTERTRRHLLLTAEDRIEASRRIAVRAVHAGRLLVPEGWQLTAAQPGQHSTFVVVVAPPDERAHRAHLRPQLPEGWAGELVTQTGQPHRALLPASGDARTSAPGFLPRLFPGLHEALTAAVNALTHAARGGHAA